MLKKEPVLILLNGTAVVVNLFLVMFVVLNVIDLDGAQITAIVAAIQGLCALLSAVIRGTVYSPATYNATGGGTDGELKLSTREDGVSVYTLELNDEAEALGIKDSVSFKVVVDPSSSSSDSHE